MINETPSLSIYESWNDVYLNNNVWELPWVSKEIHPELKKVIDSLPIKKGNALDIGCGLGQVSRYLAQVGFDVTAIDISEEAIRLSRELNDTGKHIAYRVANSIHFQCDKKFDLIVDFLHLHDIQIDSLNKYLLNVTSLLNYEGYLITCFFNNLSKNNYFTRKSHYAKIDIHYYTVKEILRILKNYNLNTNSQIIAGKGFESYAASLLTFKKSKNVTV